MPRWLPPAQQHWRLAAGIACRTISPSIVVASKPHNWPCTPPPAGTVPPARQMSWATPSSSRLTGASWGSARWAGLNRGLLGSLLGRGAACCDGPRSALSVSWPACTFERLRCRDAVRAVPLSAAAAAPSNAPETKGYRRLHLELPTPRSPSPQYHLDVACFSPWPLCSQVPSPFRPNVRSIESIENFDKIWTDLPPTVSVGRHGAAWGRHFEA